MTAAEEKIRVIEKVLETEDAWLLREIASLLHTPALADYAPQSMTQNELLDKVDRAEKAYQHGEVTDHKDVKKAVVTWRNR